FPAFAAGHQAGLAAGAVHRRHLRLLPFADRGSLPENTGLDTGPAPVSGNCLGQHHWLSCIQRFSKPHQAVRNRRNRTVRPVYLLAPRAAMTAAAAGVVLIIITPWPIQHESGKRTSRSPCMRLLKHRTRHSPPGTAPGTVTIQPGARKPQLDVTSFGPNAHPASIRRIRLDATESLPELPAGHTVRWLNVAGLGDAEVLQAVGRRFNIHALTLEDIAGTAHRPKAEAYDNYLFIVTQVPIIDKPSPANESDESGMYTAADEPAI